MFEDLKEAKYISIDLETYDPDLKTLGCGALRNGIILGIAVATEIHKGQYYSLNHKNSFNHDPKKIFNYLREQLARDTQIKVGANILYDLEYLAVNNVFVKGKIFDILIAEPLIDENQYRYNLDSCAQKYLGLTKESHEIEELCKAQKLKGDFRQYLSQFSSELVGKYAIGDVELPLKIMEKQFEIITKEDLTRVLDIELRLLPLLLQMKLEGCRINVNKASQLRDELVARRSELIVLIEKAGLDHANTDQGKSKMAAFLTSKKLTFPVTPKTKKPSFKADFLDSIDLPEIKLLKEYKIIEHFLGTFLESQILNTVIGDRIHAQFNSLRDSLGGTVTGRFSSSKPNLQNIPNSSTPLGKKCRALFIPEKGELFGSIDYSQIEYRILCHYARGDGSKEIQKSFNENPHLDVHAWCAEVSGLCNADDPDEIKKEARKQAKGINFGIIYGQGATLTAKVLGLELNDAKAFLAEYNTKMPFAKETANEAMKIASQRAFVRTILGRRRRFNLWENAEFGDRDIALSYEEAKLKWKHIKRASTYKALNAVIQGSSADLLKMAMVEAYEQGLFKILKPLTTVHDELNVSIPDTVEGHCAFDQLKNIMESVYKFKVPIIAEAGIGANWHEAK